MDGCQDERVVWIRHFLLTASIRVVLLVSTSNNLEFMWVSTTTQEERRHATTNIRSRKDGVKEEHYLFAFSL